MSADPTNAEPLPSYSSLKAARITVFTTRAGCRLEWWLDGALEDSIFVLNEEADHSGPHEPYFQGVENGRPKWHPIADKPLTYPRVSSIAVRIQALDNRVGDWEDLHLHAEPGMAGCVFGPPEQGEEEGLLLACCGERRPGGRASQLVVRASSKPYVTVHDYVSAVHPWLLPQKRRISAAINFNNLGTPFPQGTRFVLELLDLSSLTICEEDVVIWELHKIPPNSIVHD